MSKLGNFICDIDSKYIYDKEPFAHGSNGFIYKGTFKDNEDKNLVAIKKIYRRDISNEFEYKKHFWREVELLSSINHPFCLKIINFSINPPIIVTPFMSEGTLEEFLERNDPDTFNATQKMCTIYALCSTMSAIHSIGIIHRDLKPANIFMQKNDDLYDIYIADFGSARRVDKNSDITVNPKITPKYAAPETFEENIYSNSIDVYSFGVIFYQYFKYELVFENGTRPLTIFAFMNNIMKNIRFIKLPEMNNDQYRLYMKCTSNNDLERPTFKTITQLFEENESLWLPGVDKSIFVNYIEKCKKIYQDFITVNQHMVQLNEVSPVKSKQSLNLTRSTRLKRSRSSIQTSNEITAPQSVSSKYKSTRSRSSRHIDYLSTDEK